MGAITGEAVHKAAAGGDPTAQLLFADMGYWLGVGIATLVNLLDPQIVILGGGIPAAAGKLLMEPVRGAFREFVFAPSRRELPPIAPALLGPEAGIIGAALLAADTASDLEDAHG